MTSYEAIWFESFAVLTTNEDYRPAALGFAGFGLRAATSRGTCAVSPPLSLWPYLGEVTLRRFEKIAGVGTPKRLIEE
jgi:hypothetical protein